MSDGNLRSIFRQHLPEAMWVPIETWSTGQGVPDGHFIFLGGKSGWVENKLTSTDKVEISPGQIGWLERYARYGGRCFIAVRRKSEGGPRLGPPSDELWLCKGEDVRLLATQGLACTKPLGVYPGGPANWNWQLIKAFLTSKK